MPDKDEQEKHENEETEEKEETPAWAKALMDGISDLQKSLSSKPSESATKEETTIVFPAPQQPNQPQEQQQQQQQPEPEDSTKSKSMDKPEKKSFWDFLR